MSTATKKPTMADVSAACGGLHRNTVSKILNGTYTGNPETIASVREKAQELGYPVEGVESKAKPEAAQGAEIDLPEGVTITEPETKLTANHKFTMHYQIEVECEWDYDTDKDGNPILESRQCVGTEMMQFEQCLPAYPTRREVEMHIAQRKHQTPNSV